MRVQSEQHGCIGHVIGSSWRRTVPGLSGGVNTKRARTGPPSPARILLWSAPGQHEQLCSRRNVCVTVIAASHGDAAGT